MFDQIGRTLRHRGSRVIARLRPDNLQEWAGVTLGFLTLIIAVRSIEQAKWINPQPSLVFVLFLAVVLALLVVKSRLPNRLAYPLAVILGLVVIVWQSTALVIPPEGKSALDHWWYTLSALQLNEGTLYFGMFLVIVTFLTGYFSTWFILRRRNVWVAVAIGAIMILINLSNLPRSNYYFLPVYLLMALLLIGQANLARQDALLKKWKVRYPHRGITYFIAVVLCISVLTITTAWLVPEPPVDQMGLITNGGGSQGAGTEKSWFNIFASVPSKWSLIQSSDQETLLFEDPVGGGSKILYVITANRTGFWRTRRYDTYHGWGWTSSIASDRILNPGVTANDGELPGDSDVLTYTVENRLKTDVVLTGGELRSVDIPVLLKILPANEAGEESTTASAESLTTTDANHTVSSRDEDVITVVTAWLLQPYQRYQVVSHLNSATPEELSRAGEDYDRWVTDYYLQLPDSLPERVRLTSRMLTSGQETPYDKVIAIKEFLNGFEYDLEADPPAEGIDGVDCFLFSNKKGTCVNFASVMVVMLRSAGVPARLCTGYLKGELDKDSGDLVIRSRNSHAWVEVYFPGYGWMEFEATPSSEEAENEGIVSVGNTFQDVTELDPLLGVDIYGPTGGTGSSSDVGSSRIAGARQSGLPPYIYIVIVGVPVLLFFAARLVLARWVKRLRRVTNAVEAYSRMCYLASLGRSAPAAHETPLEYSTRLALALPSEAEEINNIVHVYMDTRYSPRKELEYTSKVKLQKSWVRLCDFLVRNIFRLRRRPA